MISAASSIELIPYSFKTARICFSLLSYDSNKAIIRYLLFLSWVNNLNSVINASVLTFGLVKCCLSIVSSFDEVHHSTKVNKLVSNDFIISIKSDTCNVSFSHFKVRGPFLSVPYIVPT